jgi:hypothetical protein
MLYAKLIRIAQWELNDGVVDIVTLQVDHVTTGLPTKPSVICNTRFEGSGYTLFPSYSELCGDGNDNDKKWPIF